ncbi:four helix bundle protein [Flavivirga spongiicola]|uniref:Four helix bundle protein n=1 Tax=Flavivirga spongiicola TaxID=421621 RepID=A0ABU7XZ50_9FLAO|nr:four helix bundle protein [Flavivirga sp. MEBiC05379]MDO5981059.1 four helix bundle protein [Flavivirga sp. MEBiC05379]
MKEALKKRTKIFAHNCIKVTEFFPKTYLTNHIKMQLIRCSTSVAANYRATCVAQSKPSFVAKISIVIEEVDESNFWLEFALDENLIQKDKIEFLLKESSELTAIFMASRKTASTNNK